ncbi:MAG: type III-B CRISPR-associated protein Cas10/Cmr2 [Verrucomicrobiales bacterium]|nr:type III-B CRISPR-associated protein Cas10/Cmr2 [Verrucomicrobiales bacterium]
MSGTLLKLQIGPVQDFIAQARSTRDLWSGSYLLSWLSGHVIHRVAKLDPSVEIVFPRLNDGPGSMLKLIASLGTPSLGGGRGATLPTVPNQLLAKVPAGVGKTEVEGAIAAVFDWGTDAQDETERSEWRRICDGCRRFLRNKEAKLEATWKTHSVEKFESLLWELWDGQLKDFWQVSWLLWPAPGEAVEEAALAGFFARTPVGRLWRTEQPQAKPNEWLMRHQVASHCFEARRHTCDFRAWDGVSGLDKDSLSGKEEALTTKEWFKQIPRGKDGKEVALNHLFRNNDPLAAPNLVKRVWHKAYLEPSDKEGGRGLNRRTLEQVPGSYFDIPSVPGIAAFPWARRVWEKNREERFEGAAFRQFRQAVIDVRDYLPLELPRRLDQTDETPAEWLKRVDWEIFREEFWREQLRVSRKQNPAQPEWEKAATAGLEAVRRFIREEGLGSPSSYYAVLAGDGDKTGRWQNGIDPDGKPFDFDRQFHERMSAGLGGFAAENTQRIVEDIAGEGLPPQHFQGKLIYAGGEDVLAILPADQAVDCAARLRQAYRERMGEQMRECGRGPFTYSVGVAIGHVKQPLQDMVQAARDAEGLAKKKTALGGFEGDALAITLFKRSGETVAWGAKFGSKALDLLHFFRTVYRRPVGEPNAEMPVTGRFPHRVVQVLSRLGPETLVSGKVEGASVADLAEAEVAWVIRQQTRKAGSIKTKEHLKALREDLLRRCRDYLSELRDRSRPLSEFYDLFAVEAFIARQGD